MASANFGDIPPDYSAYEKSRIVILPVPFDKTSTWLRGADKGPDAIIGASANMELYDIETDSEVFREGIFTDKPVSEDSSPESMAEAVKEAVTRHILNGKFVALIGGNHCVSIGAIRAFAERYSGLCVLQLDAHSDLREEYEGSRYSHACVMARAKELCPVVQVGIRSMDSSEKARIDRSRVFFADDMRNDSGWMQRAISLLSDKVYVTIDLDAFDPSVMPSTGTPEPGGMLWHEATSLLKKVAQEKNIVGFDVVELCPGSNKAPDFMAAKLIYKTLSYKFKRSWYGQA